MNNKILTLPMIGAFVFGLGACSPTTKTDTSLEAGLKPVTAQPSAAIKENADASSTTLLKDGQSVKMIFTQGFRNNFTWQYDASANRLGPADIRSHTADELVYYTTTRRLCRLLRGGVARCHNGSGTWQ